MPAYWTPDNIEKLRGIEKNKHERKKLRAGRGSVGKVAEVIA